MLQEFISQGIPEEYAKKAAESMVKTKDNDPVAKAIKKTTGYITDTSKLDQFAEAVLEYNTIKNSEDVLLLSDAVARSRELNTHPNPDIYFEIARKYSDGFVSDRVKKISDSIQDIQVKKFYRGEILSAILWYAHTAFYGTINDNTVYYGKKVIQALSDALNAVSEIRRGKIRHAVFDFG